MLAAPDVRFATAGDAVAIAELSRDAIEYGLPGAGRWRGCAARSHRPTPIIIVVDGAGAIDAFGIMAYTDDDAHLLLFAVRAAARRRGLGSAMLGWLETVARAAGASRIRVEARRDNAGARSFYSEHGYHELAILPRNYSGLVDGVRLEKWLRDAA
ncbi:GNAT family N-acetyltransferase [Ramlibacter terrae]|uniref:GNAT family N-acetyltransferase n=1 Tax=Ramlibacter terrae TaxID=2732511 RepID=A0ABX6P9Q0_9BURK|nr:GNAT family N-acetyltransferase [Ramlibacter terrae]